MAQNITITIPNPILTAGQHFKVRFKLHSNPNWTLLPNQTNTPFSINNLADGDYDIEYTVVMADSSECPPRIDHFNILTKSCPCITNVIGKVVEKSANNFEIRLTFTNPVTNPACGWTVTLLNSTNQTATFNYPTITSPLIIPLMSNDAFIVRIIADCCGREQVECAVLDLPRAHTSTCIPATYSTSENQCLVIQSGGQYFLQVTVTQQSNPLTSTFNINYQQQQTNAFYQIDTGSVSVAPTGSAPNILLTFPINPEPHNPGVYTCNVQDVCGQYVHVFRP